MIMIDLTRKTLQEMFDEMVRGLASQGWEESNNGAGCAYRGEDGRKCAVGWLIPDDKYKPEMDTGTVLVDVLVSKGYLAVSPTGKDFLYDAQNCHDGASDPEFRRQLFVDLAERWGLTWPEGVPQ